MGVQQRAEPWNGQQQPEHPLRNSSTDWCLVKERVVGCRSPQGLYALGSLSLFCRQTLPGCLGLRIRSVELALGHTPIPNPQPEAGRLEGPGRWRGAWGGHLDRPRGLPHILPPPATSSVN